MLAGVCCLRMLWLLASVVLGAGAGAVDFTDGRGALSLPVEAATPPRGLNSWDSFLLWVSEENVTASAEAMERRGLVSLGWQYYVIDMGWYVPRTAWNSTSGGVDASKFATDGRSRMLPDPQRFPSSAGSGSLAPLCAQLKSKHGVLCGVHLVTGVPIRAVQEKQPIENSSWTAADIAGTIHSGGQSWNLLLKRIEGARGPALHEGAQAYYDSVVSQLGSWGVRFIKLDWAWQQDGLEPLAVRAAIVKSGYDIVLSVNGICEDPTWRYCVNANASARANRSGADYAQMWRIGGDLWDNWGQVAGTPANRMHYHAAPYNWPDNDMLPFGPLVGTGQGGNGSPWVTALRPSNLTHAEAQFMMSFWAISQSPLMLGGFFPYMSEADVALLTNREVLDLNAHGTRSAQLWSNSSGIAWRSERHRHSGSQPAAVAGGGAAQSVFYCALLNLQERAEEVGATLARSLSPSLPSSLPLSGHLFL
eukprot:COSAG03_NODE_872_length_5556_cov_14.930365_4_plen_477_part_00